MNAIIMVQGVPLTYIYFFEQGLRYENVRMIDTSYIAGKQIHFTKNLNIFLLLHTYFYLKIKYQRMSHSVHRPFPTKGALEHFKTLNTSCVVFAW